MTVGSKDIVYLSQLFGKSVPEEALIINNEISDHLSEQILFIFIR